MAPQQNAPTLVGSAKRRDAGGPDDLAQPNTRNPLNFVLLRRYCELTGESVQAVHDRRRRGQWQDGKHCTVVDGRRLWINLPEVEKWIRQGGRSST